MAGTDLHKSIWALVRSQHGVVARRQLVELGASRAWVEHRIAKGRLHPIHPGVYAAGRPDLTQEGRWIAAVLACGNESCLSHPTAAANYEIRFQQPGAPIHISLNAAVVRHPQGITVHRSRTLAPDDITTHNGIPTTTPARTLIDLATMLTPNQLEAAVTQADVLDLIDPETLRAELEERRGVRGVPAMRTVLDRHTYRMTESELERRFLRIVKRAGLPLPDTQEELAGRVDFHWHALGLVVETDGWRYHRTPARQAKDNRRMQQHLLAGRSAIRISHYEIRNEAGRVVKTLGALAARLSARPTCGSRRSR